jgi:hypothetical protein
VRSLICLGDIKQPLSPSLPLLFSRPPEVYCATESPTTGMYFCPMPQCDGQSQVPGLIFATIFVCGFPRISFVFQLRVPIPYRSVSVVDCRRRWRISMEVTTALRCVSGDGRENSNMQLPCIPRRPSHQLLASVREDTEDDVDS